MKELSAGAIGMFRRLLKQVCAAVSGRQENAEDWHERGNQSRQRGDWETAAACYRKALSLRPGHLETLNGLGFVYCRRKKYEEARTCFEQALALNPDSTVAHLNLGNICSDLGQADQAMCHYRKVLAVEPQSRAALHNLGTVLTTLGRIEEAVACYRQLLRNYPDFSDAWNYFLFALNAHPFATSQEIFAEHRRWAGIYADPLTPASPRHGNLRDARRRLRLGYVSGDFRLHAVSPFIGTILTHHDHEQYHVFCYSNSEQQDQVTKSLQGCADAWRDIAGMPDEKMAEAIKRDKIDILVDLSGHSQGNRLLVFARKPAPVQVTYLGYLNTTGMRAMDYRITDDYADPAGVADGFYTERLIRLPHTLWCYQPLLAMPEVGSLPAEQQGYITFGSLNHFVKINQRVLDCWIKLLLALPSSRLIIAGVPKSEAEERLLGEFHKHDISAGRLTLVPRVPYYEFLRLYQEVDIGLDPFPYAGGATTCESLWMGVPVITLAGDAGFSRSGMSVLSNLGLTQFIADDPEQYVTAALNLGGDVTRLKELRASLRDRMRRSPLTDAAQFTRNLEAAYREVWRDWCTKGESGN